MTNRTNYAVTTGWTLLLLGGFAACAWVLIGESARAQGPAPKSSPPGGATAEAILRRTTDFYKKAKSAEVEVDQAQKIGDQALKSTCTLVVQRPNRFAIRVKSDLMGMTVVSDGKTLSVLIPPLQKYTQTKAPDTLEIVLGDPIVQSSLQGMMVTELFAADPYAKFMEGVKTATLAGQETIDGTKTHHLKFTQDQFDWEMWVAIDGDPVVRRVALDLSKALAKMPGQFKNQNMKMELIQTFKDWRIDREIDKEAFVFQPPKDAQKVEDFMAALGAGAAPQRSELVGKPAPDVNLKLLEQGNFRLKDHRDTHLVMLDFWATWCGPCVEELPLLAAVAEDYKDKGLVFYAVNQAEQTDAIHKFLKEKKLAINVALDPEGSIGAAYHVEAIPALVLIDKKGVVQSVHVGFNPAIKATLHKEIDALLAGKDLAKESLADEAKKTRNSRPKALRRYGR